MTKEKLQEIVEIQQCFDFEYRGVKYLLTSERNSRGSYTVHLGRRDEASETFEDLTDFLAHAKIENQFVRELLDIL